MTDSSNDELEKLKKQRAELESKLLANWKHRTPFEVEAEIVREKVAIQELKKELDRVNDRAPKANPERINVGELEDKLKSTKEFATSGIIQKSGAEVKDKIDKPETDEQTRTIWKKNEQPPESDETPKEQEKEKKKRKFF
jgi:hypothetical protein